MEIPLLLEKLGLAGDTLPEVMIIAVGGRICWRMFGGFLIGRGRTLLGSDLTPYSEIAQPATRVVAPAAFLQHAIYPKYSVFTFCGTADARRCILLFLQPLTQHSPFVWYRGHTNDPIHFTLFLGHFPWKVPSQVLPSAILNSPT